MTGTDGWDPYEDVPPLGDDDAPPEWEGAPDAVVVPFDRAERQDRKGAGAKTKHLPRALVLPPPDCPLPVARELIRALWTDAEGRELIASWRGQWAAYAGTHWEVVSRATIRAILQRAVEQAVVQQANGEVKPWNPNSRRMADLMEALASAVHRDDEAEEDRVGRVAMGNGILDLETLELAPHTPEWFSFTCLPYDYAPLAGEPIALLAFCRSVWGDDAPSIGMLQEWLGYAVSGSLAKQKALLLVGARRAGKGTILKLLTALVGAKNCAPLTLDALGRQFGLQRAIGKTLGLIADARQDGRSPALLIERLLMIIAGDAIEVDIKNREPWHGQLALRLVMASNEVPRFRDNSGAVASRFLILRFTRSMLGKEDEALDARLAAEMPAIFNWALSGLRRLEERGRFSEPESAMEDRELLDDLASPVNIFAREILDVGEGFEEKKDVVYAFWRAWCEKNGHEPGSTTSFTRSLRAAFPSVTARGRAKAAEGYGDRPRVYGGVRLKPGVATHPDAEPVVVGRWSDGAPATVDRCLKCGDLLGPGEHGCVFDAPPPEPLDLGV
ncbi:DNA primase family protein [Mycolicibacterium fallax]|nr:phage/plasmid primase, P4 family [Mycolicibacterium fallax]